MPDIHQYPWLIIAIAIIALHTLLIHNHRYVNTWVSTLVGIVMSVSAALTIYVGKPWEVLLVIAVLAAHLIYVSYVIESIKRRIAVNLKKKIDIDNHIRDVNDQPSRFEK